MNVRDLLVEVCKEKTLSHSFCQLCDTKVPFATADLSDFDVEMI